jgi:hypothetical protein
MSACPINPGHEYVPMPIYYTDNDGNEVEDEVCWNCQYATESDKKQPTQNKEIKLELSNFQGNPIKHFGQEISQNIEVPLDIGEAVIEHLIGIALMQCYFRTKKGRIRTNLMFKHTAPSGHNKTPLIILQKEEIINKAFADYNYHMEDAFSTKGLAKKLNDKKDTERTVPVIIFIDEDSETIRENKNGQGFRSFEGISKIYDGELSSNATVTNGSYKRIKVFAPIWTAGVPDGLEDLDRRYFNQGYAWRTLHLIDDGPLKDDAEVSEEEVKKFENILNRLIQILKEIQKIKKATATPEFYMLYKEEKNLNNKLKSEVETNRKYSDLSEEKIKIEAMTKGGELIFKLAMIHSASRMYGGEEIVMDAEDFYYARDKFHFYVKNTVKFFRMWEDQARERSIFEEMERMKNLLKRGHMRTVEIVYQEKKECYDVVEGKTGKWVQRSDLLRRSNLKVSGFKSFDEVINTLEERRELTERVAKSYRKASKGTGMVPMESLYYKLTEEEE